MFKRNKLFILCLMVSISLFLVGDVFADATITSARNARTASMGKGIQQVIGVAGIRNGKVLEVDGEGSASVKEYPKTIATSEGLELNTGVALVGSACRVSNIIFGGVNVAAGGYLLVYDAASATGTPKFEIAIGLAQSTIPLTIPGGATFSTGVFVVGSATNQHVTITYDN